MWASIMPHVPVSESERRLLCGGGTANPRSISLIGTTHPSTAKRYLAIEKAVEEIQRKRVNGELLIPEER